MPAFSVNMMPNIPAKEIADLANYAERKGCKRCWVYDEGLTTRDVYVTLAAVALKTKTIQLGPGITNAYVRHPAATASAIATLDELSDGRAFVGIGAGGGLTLDPMCISRTNPLTTVREMVESLRSLFQKQKTTFEGTSFSLSNARLSYGRPDLEIILAGRGPKMLQLGADIADGFYLSYIYKDHLSRVMSVLRNGRASKQGNFHVTYSTMLATNEKELTEARGQLSFRLVDSPEEIKQELGMTRNDVLRIKQALSEGGTDLAGDYVKEEWVEKFVLVGDRQSCKEELLRLLESNEIDEFQLPIHQPSTAKELIDQVAGFFSGA
ncbi:MAG: LLM class flavin-dependent oxidoreductase [Acidimicrobiales bacterium]|jgi:5,10-methylenetetrahydromethanopterin reductase|nr:LLM class flavin-dependent oxidoreductase [Acidimicrobiales bacterium]MDP6298284.1 LLM class flavin-dependent oxidoreductase [Acidimicrobiales bacterium]HJM28586.1 LLM class flavin-dependent oxidoreductase [Acidimicrobiales bacterium]